MCPKTTQRGHAAAPPPQALASDDGIVYRGRNLWPRPFPPPADARREIQTVEKQFKIIVEQHPDGYVAYPLGLKGVVVGQGDTYVAALEDVRSAVAFHVQTFGDESIADDSPVIEAFVAEAGVDV